MLARVACLLLAAGGVALAATPATRPTTAPSTHPAARIAGAAGRGGIGSPARAGLLAEAEKPVAKSPTTLPATVEPGKGPRKIGDKKPDADEQDAPKVVYIDLDRPVSERPAPFILLQDPVITLQSVVSRLRQARDDKEVKGVLVTFGQTEFNLSQAAEIRDALSELGKAGKKTFVYADSYETASYIAASGATDICMLGGGDVMIPGVGIESMFAKGLLDKVGVKADYVQIGEYKGADEEYTREHASDELRGEMNKLVDGLYRQIVAGIATARKLDPREVRAMIDESIVTGKAAKARGLVDHLVDIDGLRDLLAKELGGEVDLDGEYGLPPKEKVDLSNLFALMQSLSKAPAKSTKPAVAVIYAQGVIVDGSDDDMFGEGGNVASDDFRAAVRMAVRDDRVKAIVLRIDSPGGSALASEAMWQSVRRAEKTKPVIVSIGGMAASGGYYLASSGDRIFADPTAIVGSIGVVGGKFVYKDLYDWLGLHTETFARGKNSGLFSSSQPWTDAQRKMVTDWMKETYTQFTQRVMSRRKGKIADIDKVARGRIFPADQALNLGMVDEMGGIEEAIKYAAHEVDMAAGTYEVRAVPQSKTVLDIIRGAGAEEATHLRPSFDGGKANPLAAILGGPAGRMVKEQLRMMSLLQKRPIMLASPWVITLK